MTYAEKLLLIEKQKEDLLKQSTEDMHNHYFCFVNTTPVHFMSSKTPKDIKDYGVFLSFEFVIIPKKGKSQFFSIEFTTTIKMDRVEKKLVFSHSTNSSIKSINQPGMFFINNYNDLSESQRKKSISQIDSYYDKLQEDDDCWTIPSLDIGNIIHYFKQCSDSLSIKQFITAINKNIDNIIEQHLSTIVIEKVTTWHSPSEKTYSLTAEDKKYLSKDIKKNLPSSVGNCIKPLKLTHYSQEGWIDLYNDVIEWLQGEDIAIKPKTATKKKTD